MKKSSFVLAFLVLFSVFTSACGKEEKAFDRPYQTSELFFKEKVPNTFADKFCIYRYENNCSLICVADGNRYLIVPENVQTPKKLESDIRVIKRPVENIYLAATSAMGIFDALECGDAIRFSGTNADDWYIDYAKNAMKNGSMLYAGKYREPDYELLLSEKCRLSIQSSMIGHSPEVKEKLEELGIPVFIDYSSYETHPLGRSEWIKVYGEMMGESELAEKLFNEQAELLNSLEGFEDTGKTAVFFYVNSSGQVVTRKPGDYITKMIELAGGKNILKNTGDENASSMMIMEIETFYSSAKDADFIIYNSAIEGEITSIDDLTAKNSLLADFKAVKEGNVWCTSENLFQETMKLGTVTADLNAVFTGNYKEKPPQFLRRLGGNE